MKVWIKKKYVDKLINKAFIVDNYETIDSINSKMIEKLKDEEHCFLFLVICISLFIMLITICSGFNILSFVVLWLIGNFPFILCYLNVLISKNKLKKVQMNKEDLLCYSSNNFSVDYVRNYSSGRGHRVEVIFSFDDGVRFSIPYGDLTMEIRKLDNYIEEKIEFNSLRDLKEYYSKADLREDFSKNLKYVKNVNIYFYEKLLKKDKKANIITFYMQGNMENFDENK